MWVGQPYTDRHTAPIFNDSPMWIAPSNPNCPAVPGYSKTMIQANQILHALCLDRGTRNSHLRNDLLVSLGYIVCNMGYQPYGCLHLAPTFNDTFKRSAFAPFLVSLGCIACNGKTITHCPPHRYYLQRLLRRLFFRTFEHADFACVLLGTDPCFGQGNVCYPTGPCFCD